MTLNIIETFVGAGGGHIGFKQSGFSTIFVNDINKDCIETLLLNNMITNDEYLLGSIEDLTEETIKSKINNKTVHLIAGGIPCCGYSSSGLRNPFDKRNYLYKHQLKLVELIKPKVSVIENVQGIKSMILYKECEETKNIFKQYDKLNDENKKLNGEKSSRRKNNKNYEDLNIKIIENKTKMKILLKSIDKYKYNVLDDIKRIYLENGYKYYEKVLQADKYECFTNRKRIIIVAVHNSISKEYKFPDEINKKYILNDALNLIDYNNINNPLIDKDNIPMKHNEKTIERFKLIPEGNNITEILDEIPEDLKISAFYSRGNTQRLNRNMTVPTLVPGHSNFPLHPFEHRSITVREAATITGFPCNYKFVGSHTSRCLQVGNAIPIKLAYHIGLSIKKILED